MLLYLQIILAGFEQTALSIYKYLLCTGARSRYLIRSEKRINFEAADELVLVEARHPDAGGRDRDHPDAPHLSDFNIYTIADMSRNL